MLSSINTEVVRNMGMHGFEYLTIVTLLALIQFIWLGARVGAARGKYGVSAPATTGHDLFERHYRVHYNTLEALVVFLPALWAFGYYLGQYWAAGLGVVYLVGRVIYAISYVKDPKSRGMGVLLSSLPVYILLLGGLGAAIWDLLVG
ncbi:MAG: MAPEG family protein [SAR86 cluster bacterium]